MFQHPQAQASPKRQGGKSGLSAKSNRLPKLSGDERELNGIDAGVCSLQGRRPYQEDQFAICRFLSDPSSQIDVPETHFFGVFDGHAGGKCSKAICTTIPYQFCRDESFPTKISVALKKAIHRTNEQFLEIAGKMRLNDGSTAVCVVLRGLSMTVSNVGDSRAVLISNRKGIALTEDHKPTCPSEQERIESFGGSITFHTGIARVAGILAVSRAFGNYSIRHLIRADPDIIERELSSHDDFLVLASDGLWDVFSADDVAEICYSWEKYGVNRIAQQLVQLAITRGSMDNVTAVVVSLSKYYSRISAAQRQTQIQSQPQQTSQVKQDGNAFAQTFKRAATPSSVLTAANTKHQSHLTGGGTGEMMFISGDSYAKNDIYDDETLIGDDGTIADDQYHQTTRRRSQSNSIGHSSEDREASQLDRGGSSSGDRKTPRLSPSLAKQQYYQQINQSGGESSTNMNQKRPNTPQQLNMLPPTSQSNGSKSGRPNLGNSLPIGINSNGNPTIGSLFHKNPSLKSSPPLFPAGVDRIHSPIVSNRKRSTSTSRPASGIDRISKSYSQG